MYRFATGNKGPSAVPRTTRPISIMEYELMAPIQIAVLDQTLVITVRTFLGPQRSAVGPRKIFERA
jgi:hypothetical protein